MASGCICDKCGEFYKTLPFHNMNAAGDCLYSRIKLINKEYDLCPSCTLKVENFIKKGGF